MAFLERLAARFVAWVDGGRTILRTEAVIMPHGSAWLRVELDNRFAWYPTEDLAARGDTVRHGIVWVPPMTGWTERWRAA
jgi:hypothetical protein